MKKRLLSLLLAFVMVLGMIPAGVFAVEGIPFTATVDGEEMTEITEGVVSWTDWSGMTADVTCYTVAVPQSAIEATLEFTQDMQWTYYTSAGEYIGEGETSWSAQTTHTVAVQDSNGDGELDGISVQDPSAYSTAYYILFVYAEAAPTSCLAVNSDAPTAAETKSGGMYQLDMDTVFTETQGHEVTYSYSFNGETDSQFTKLENGVLYLTATSQSEEGEPFELVLTATCEGGQVSHTVELTVGPPNQGIDAQYSYDETDKSSVTVYVTISNDGLPLGAEDDAVLANLEVTVPYFDLSLYGLEQYYRYGTDGGTGPYVNTNVVRRPTGLHLYIYLLERYYMGLPEEQCCLGTSGVLEYANERDVLYMNGETAYSSNGYSALEYSGGATSIFMNEFWGHDCNVMYFRNHCYPYMSPGWGSTSDYILLSDGDSWDVAMFTDWSFYHSGYFASFDKDVYTVEEGGSTLTVKTQKWGTTAAADAFEPVYGNAGMSITLYDSQWQELESLSYDSQSSNTVTFNVPEEDGVYYLLATDPNSGNSAAKIAPAAARILVGSVGGSVDVSTYYENYDFVSIKDDQDRYLVDITPGTLTTDYNGDIPVHQVIIEEGTEKVYVTFESGYAFVPYIALYDVNNGTADYDMDMVMLNIVTNEDGTVTVEIPVASYTDTGTGVILEDGNYAWVYGFDFVTGTITKVTVGTSVSRILLDSYSEKLWIGDSVQLTPSVLPAEATDWTIEWSSSDETIATVDQTGKVTATGEGTATITAAIGDVKATCTVTAEKYNTAPSVVSGSPSWAKVKTNVNHTVDVAAMFTDAQSDELTYTVQVCKATGLSSSWEYSYTAADGFDITVSDGKFSASFPEIGIYGLKITANDGKLSTTHTYQVTVVNNDAGVVKLNDGVTMDLYNVVAVGYSTEFVEDYEIPYKGTHDTTIHHIVLSKDTLSGTPSRKFAITLESGYLWGQYSASGKDSSFQTRANIGVFAYDPNLSQSTAHFLQFHTECATHTDEDSNSVCDKCTMELAPAGQFALMAVNADGFVIEPCYVSYAAGATVKDALKASGYTFEGIDSGFISSINGVVDNYSVHYDGDGYSLDAAADHVTALWFTANSSQVYSDDLRDLVSQMALYNSSTGVKVYAAAQDAYSAAAEDFYQTSNAKALYSNLKAAMDTYDAFATAEKVSLTLNITQGDSSLQTGLAVFTSEFGTTHSFTDFTAVELAPATYDFDVSDGSYRHVRGSITVAQGAALTATVPDGTWITSLQLGASSNFDLADAMPMSDVTASSATYYMLDSQGASIYPYAVPAEDLDTSACKLYYRGYSYARTWASQSAVVTTTYTGLKAKSMVGTTGVFEAVVTDGDYEQYQTFTCTIVRVPTLAELTVKGDGSVLNTEFGSTLAVTTTADSVDVLSKTLCEGVTVEVNGVSGTAVNVPLSSCQTNEDGTYKISVVLKAENGQTNEYTVNVTQVAAAAVTVTHDTDVTVDVMNPAGSVIAPVSSENGTDTYKLIPGESYTWIATKNTYYHATGSFTATEGLSVTAATPKTEDWGTNIAARTASAATSQLTPDAAFTAADHTYVFTVESNTAAMRILAASKSTSTYAVTVYYTSHDNSNYSTVGGTNGPKEYAISITSNTSYKVLTNILAVGGWDNSFRIEYKQNTAENGVTYYQDYYVDVVRSMTLNSMSATDHNDAALTLTQKGTTTTGFVKTTFDYEAVVASGAQQMSLTLKPLSSNKYDYGYTVTVACGSWSQVIDYSEELTPNTAQTVQIPLSGTVEDETVTVTVAHEEESSIAGVYTVAITKLPPINTTFTVTPADATIFLTEDSNGNRIYPEADGTYILNTDAAYTYVITKNGYVAQTGSFVAGEENKAISATLEQAAATEFKDISQEGDWLQFRADDNNNGVVDVKTPIKAEDAVLEWANKIGDGFDSGATGCPIIVGGYIYTYAGNSIVKVNKDTGEVVDSGVMAASSSFAINSPTYADGMIFVGLSGGRVQAFNAETLESLWLFTDAKGGQPNCPIVYCDGYVYTGFWNSENKQANYVCLSVADEDGTQTTEAKLPTWTVTHNGFYWAGAYACKDFVLIGTDDGAAGYTTGYASILSLDPKTGVVLDQQKLPNVGDQRSSICYDEATDAYYFTTKGGDFYQVKVNADGTFKENSLRRLHLDNGSGSDSTPPMSTSTPVIYNGRAYIGVSGTGQFSAYSGHNMTVIDLETFSIAYTVPTMGYPQTSGLLTTAYEDTDGYVYVYFVDNFTPGMIRVIRDKKGMTEVDHSYTTTVNVTTNGETVAVETGYILFSPYGDEAQYAICSPIADSEGNLYFKNDTARLMRLSSRLTSLEVTCQPEKLAYTVGSTFDGTGMQVVAHYANGVTKDVTGYLSYTTEPLTADDTEITVSFDPDKQFESTTTAAGGYWQWYQNVDGQAGETYYLPTATVNIQFVPVAQVGEETYLTVQEAIDAAEGSCVKLLEDVTADVVISGQVYLDLNGKELTGSVSGDGALYGMDSATDGYDCANMGRITGTVSCTVVAQHNTDAKRYLAIADETGYTFHRFYVGVTKMSLKPNQTALGYKAFFAGDDMVKEAISGFGIKLWVEGFEEKAVTLRYEQADFVSGKEVTARVQNIDVKNFAETDICAQAFVILGEQTVESTAVSGNLRGMLEKVNNTLDSYTDEQKAVVAEFVKTWYSVMKTWDINNIYTEA